MPITLRKVFPILFFLVLCYLPTYAQDEGNALKQYNLERIQYNKQGMLILGSWAVGNMLWGGFMAGRTSGELQGFHQMNAYWNSVNLLIAGFGYYSAMKEVPSAEFWETIQQQQSIEKILLVNAGLDVAYMATGLYMLERGKRKDDARIRGFGKSVILQGAFLMSFDVIKYFYHHAHAQELPKIVENLSVGPNGIGLRVVF
ncbi:MAG: hypothetical protein JJU34_13815 [Lunatimonas sp.]|uniref:DUF6992 family protein n=1 Tax=Lunatimonas sp. TaxID=2060141 RepID=UPI00263B8139|nr:hypothetical protein [Lunatimonas sp.]MCC5938350.1 hypothetical protein [Lunatimonas sp.]